MAPSPLRSLTRKHTRSTSLPSRTYPLMPQFDEHLCRLRASEAIPSSLSSMSHILGDLNNLHDCNDDLLLLPHVQQAISRECQHTQGDQMLDVYLRLLDACSTTKDIFSYTKQGVQELLSALRRKGRDDLSACLTSRRKSKKMIHKALKDLRSIRNRQTALIAAKDINETISVSSMLKEVESITLTVLESLLSCVVNSSKMQSRHAGWSLVSKLLNSSLSNQDDEWSNANEFGKLDSALHNLIYEKIASNNDEILQVQNLLENIESSIQILEEELECLFRRLIKSRVSLLNILNH